MLNIPLFSIYFFNFQKVNLVRQEFRIYIEWMQIGNLVLSEVILCATGGEALYADMGQLGRKPIVQAWYFVFGALLLNYLGQGAYLIRYPEARNVLFEMIFYQVVPANIVCEVK